LRTLYDTEFHYEENYYAKGGKMSKKDRGYRHIELVDSADYLPPHPSEYEQRFHILLYDKSYDNNKVVGKTNEISDINKIIEKLKLTTTQKQRLYIYDSETNIDWGEWRPEDYAEGGGVKTKEQYEKELERLKKDLSDAKQPKAKILISKRINSIKNLLRIKYGSTYAEGGEIGGKYVVFWDETFDDAYVNTHKDFVNYLLESENDETFEEYSKLALTEQGLDEVNQNTRGVNYQLFDDNKSANEFAEEKDDSPTYAEGGNIKEKLLAKKFSKIVKDGEGGYYIIIYDTMENMNKGIGTGIGYNSGKGKYGNGKQYFYHNGVSNDSTWNYSRDDLTYEQRQSGLGWYGFTEDEISDVLKRYAKGGKVKTGKGVVITTYDESQKSLRSQYINATRKEVKEFWDNRGMKEVRTKPKNSSEYSFYAKGGELYNTKDKKAKAVKKKGNIITFKKKFYPRGTSDTGFKQILVTGFSKQRGSVKIEGQAYDTKWYDSIDSLIKDVDWKKMEGWHSYDKGGKVVIVNKDKKYAKADYEGIFGDYDGDGIPNIDDAHPLDPSKRGRVEPVSLEETFSNLLDLKKELDKTMYKSVDKLKKTSPKDADIYARTKTPFSIIKKLVDKRLKNPTKGLTDLIGTTIAVEDYDDLVKVRDGIRKGELGEVVEEENMYANPQDGYMAYHFIIKVNKIPVEVQLKTKRTKEVNELTHEPYKKGTINVKKVLEVMDVVNKADKGDKQAKIKYNALIKNKNKLKKDFDADKKAKGGFIPSYNIDKFHGLAEDFERQGKINDLTYIKEPNIDLGIGESFSFYHKGKDVHVTIFKYPNYPGVVIRKDFGDSHYEDEIYINEFRYYLEKN